MSEPQNVKLIAIVGLLGTGKSAAVTYLGERGMPKVSFGDVVTKAVADAGLELNFENERNIRERMRLDPTGDKVANLIIAQINSLIAAGQHEIVIDGLGGWDTYKRLKHEFPGSMTVVAFTAQRHIRYRRLAQRAEHPMTESEVMARDYDEIETLNKGGVIALADYYLFDNGSMEQLHTQIDELLRQIEF